MEHAASVLAGTTEKLGNLLPIWSVAFFVIMLLCIAILPLAAEHWWEKNSNKAFVSILLSIPVIILVWNVNYNHDLSPIAHELKGYISFILLLTSLFVVSGGLYIKGKMNSSPVYLSLLLLFGAVIANLLGTTGAAMLLIRPLIRSIRERKFHFHIPVFFIFIVCNIGGVLLPIGDPPLFMGYLKGVPFFWTLQLFPQWLFMVALVIIAFFGFDMYFYRKEPKEIKKEDIEEHKGFGILGGMNLFFLLAILVAVIIIPDALFPMREIVFVLIALLSYETTKKEVHEKNNFSFAPIIEVAVLFIGIFITMVPALQILEARAGSLGITQPWQYFWLTGGLSSFLDNVPAYLTFLSLGVGLHGIPIDKLGSSIIGPGANPQFIEILKAISIGAVFMGANTYIGNGPNFMVKAICEHEKIKVPTFFGYMAWSCGILVPLLLIVTFVFFKP